MKTHLLILLSLVFAFAPLAGRADDSQHTHLLAMRRQQMERQRQLRAEPTRPTARYVTTADCPQPCPVDKPCPPEKKARRR